jgi:hypothetical protein
VSDTRLGTACEPLAALITDTKDATSIASAYLDHHCTQQEIADHLGVHCSTVSRRLRASCLPRARNMLCDSKTCPQRS